jgi:hypothetical protein
MMWAMPQFYARRVKRFGLFALLFHFTRRISVCQAIFAQLRNGSFFNSVKRRVVARGRVDRGKGQIGASEMEHGAEAVEAMTRHTFETGKAHRIYADGNPENPASWKLLERAGIIREATLRKNVYFSNDKKGNPLWQGTYRRLGCRDPFRGLLCRCAASYMSSLRVAFKALPLFV